MLRLSRIDMELATAGSGDTVRRLATESSASVQQLLT